MYGTPLFKQFYSNRLDVSILRIYRTVTFFGGKSPIWIRKTHYVDFPIHVVHFPFYSLIESIAPSTI